MLQVKESSAESEKHIREHFERLRTSINETLEKRQSELLEQVLILDFLFQIKILIHQFMKYRYIVLLASPQFKETLNIAPI